MKKLLFSILFFSVFTVAACNTQEDRWAEPHFMSPPPGGNFQTEVSWIYHTFEEAAIAFATDIVIAQYVGRRPFGQRLTEFEFIVSETLWGDADGRVFIYIDNGMEDSDLAVFSPGTDYLLPLERQVSAYFHAGRDKFMFIMNAAVDLDNPLNSVMWWRQPLYLHSLGLNFDERDFSRQEIISYVTELTINNNLPVADSVIWSEHAEDIILDSPYILVVEINEPHRLSARQLSHDWGSTDMYNATIVSILSGEISLLEHESEPFAKGDEILAIFFADTVFTGEHHIVAATRWGESSTFRFSSPHSLFHIDQLPEVVGILAPTKAINVTAEGNATTVYAGDTLQFNAVVEPLYASQTVRWEVSGHASTSIDESGLLTVDADVPVNTVLTITATRRDINGTMSDAAEITVIAAPSGGGGFFRDPHVPTTPQQQPPTPPVEDNEDIDPQIRLQLIFTAGQVEFLFHGMPRTAVGAPFLDPATDRMMVPLRTVAESTGVEVRWDYDTRSAVIYLPDETLVIPVDIPLPDGMGSAMLVNDRTFVPLRFVMEAFGADAQWYEPNLQAIISFY